MRAVASSLTRLEVLYGTHLAHDYQREAIYDAQQENYQAEHLEAQAKQHKELMTSMGGGAPMEATAAMIDRGLAASSGMEVQTPAECRELLKVSWRAMWAHWTYEESGNG